MHRRALAVLLAVSIFAAVSVERGQAEDLSGFIHFLGYLPQLTDSFAPPAAGSLSRRGIALTLLRRYSPIGYHLIQGYESCPDQYIRGRRLDFMAYVTGDTVEEIAASLNTAVHEICHAYAGAAGYALAADRNLPVGSRGCMAVYTGTATIVVGYTPTFPTREIAQGFPDELKTLRYSTYVYPAEPNLATQVLGVYGLLDEFAAYYHGTRTAVDLFGFYRDEAAQTPENWLRFMGGVNSTFYAYLEFKLYILRYLRCAHDVYPELYWGIIGNHQFKEAFISIDRSFAQLMQRYFALKTEVQELLRRQGHSVSEDGEYFFVTEGRLRTAQPNYMKVYRLLESELARYEYREIMAVLGG